MSCPALCCFVSFFCHCSALLCNIGCVYRSGDSAIYSPEKKTFCSSPAASRVAFRPFPTQLLARSKFAAACQALATAPSPAIKLIAESIFRPTHTTPTDEGLALTDTRTHVCTRSKFSPSLLSAQFISVTRPAVFLAPSTNSHTPGEKKIQSRFCYA